MTGAAIAQTVLEPPRAPEPGTSGVGGGAGLLPPLPQPVPPAPAIAPTLPPPAAAPTPLPTIPPAPLPTITPAPAAPAAARVVRFRCDVGPGAETCREQGKPDGGGDDSECSCAKDICFDHLDPGTGKSSRVCEKSQ